MIKMNNDFLREMIGNCDNIFAKNACGGVLVGGYTDDELNNFNDKQEMIKIIDNSIAYYQGAVNALKIIKEMIEDGD